MIRALIALCSLSFAAHAAAACPANLQVPGVRLISPWLAIELARGGQLRETIDVRVSQMPGCPPLALGVELSLPSNSLARATVRSAPNGAEIGSSPGASLPPLALTAGSDGTSAVNPVVEWSAQGQVLPPGREELRLRWRLYAYDALVPQVLSELETLLIADVPAVLDVELIAAGTRVPLAGASAMLDFGELSSDAKRSVEIEVRGNTRAQLSVRRQWGQLRLRDRANYTIPYRLALNGHALSDDGGVVSLPANGEAAQAHLSVRLGDVERRAAGIYEDTLTVIIAPE
jgi:hypothetical protein